MRVIGNCELPDMRVGNRTQTLRKSSRHFLLLSHLSSPLALVPDPGSWSCILSPGSSDLGPGLDPGSDLLVFADEEKEKEGFFKAWRARSATMDGIWIV